MSVFTIPIPPKFSFQECHWFLDRNYDDCLYTVTENSIIRPLNFGGEKVVFEVKEQAGAIAIELLYTDGGDHRSEIEAFVRDWLDLDRDISGFYQLLESNSVLSYMPEAFHGLRLIGIPDLFEAICWCVIGQQINLTFAYKLKRRMVETYGESIELNGQVHYLFPKPAVLAQLEIADLKELQFSRQKADYVIHTAKMIEEGSLSKAALLAMDGREAQLKKLISVRGIGEWTANYVLMKTLKDMNCITIGDTGLNSALAAHELVKDKKNKDEVRAFFEAFEGWKSYLNIYLWRSLSVPDYGN